ncbi:hypothetical protein A2160_03285 [Candidatus Beckwithbacteria bacterium RBG_13_42_9]|uniref:Uncharacterized protein n=1 Tax=Candidatus Beckwithbacteria bacterium RBG_13_42_9 TaxID=1797457 RepID=A0A1F5E9D4_9BACT|nr:MAG: hypothetical protein A2160_03285 [Candidatus Beckwithbacteria bacterium RBG_13_42_9]
MGGCISGTVYNDAMLGGCSTATPGDNSGWTISCSGGDLVGSVPAIKPTSSTFACVDNNSTGNQQALRDAQYSITFTPPSGMNFSCAPQGTTALTNATTPNVSDLTFMYSQAEAGWFQTRGGNVFAGSTAGGETIKSQIPDTCVAPCLPYFSLPDLVTNQPGSVSRASGTDNFDNGSVSTEGWEAQTGSYQGITADYQFWRQFLGDNLVAKTISGNPDTGFWLSDIPGTLTIASDWNVSSGQKVVVLHDGDINITSNQTVAVGSSLMIVASGTITFDDAINHDVTDVQGIYIANSISTGDDSPSVAFIGKGTFVSWNSFSFGRNLGIGNNTLAAETFVYRPDLVYNLPTEVKRSHYLWQEK